MIVKQDVNPNYSRSCHGTKLMKSTLSLVLLLLNFAGGSGQPEHQGHSEIYQCTLDIVSRCPSPGEYKQKSIAKCAHVCGSNMQDENCGYHCMRDSSKTKLVEFCAKPEILFYYCPEYDSVDQTIQKDWDTLCNSTSTQNYYKSSDIYFCDPENCLKLRESSVRISATTLINETTEIKIRDSPEKLIILFVFVAALISVVILGFIDQVLLKRGFFSACIRKMAKKWNRNPDAQQLENQMDDPC